jgi:putative tryptophan/tyrosine transport system substrate-binding protein
MTQVRRRQFLLTASAFLAVPFAVTAQQAGKVRRIGVQTSTARADPETRSQIAALVARLQELGWKDGSNLHIDYRYGEGDSTRAPQLAREMLALRPEVIVAATTPAATALRQLTLSIPIVFVQVPDPVAAGFVTNLARPDGNITGFTNFEFSIGGKWLQAIKECAPKVSRVAVIFDAANPSWTAYLRAIEASAPNFGVQLTPVGARNAAELEHEIGVFAKTANGALVVLPSALTVQHRDLIISLAARHHLPAIYPYNFFASSGGLMSYGVDLPDLYRRAASYVDQILKGAKPADLPVQFPTKLELVINLKTAKALGLTISKELLFRADKVIE